MTISASHIPVHARQANAQSHRVDPRGDSVIPAVIEDDISEERTRDLVLKGVVEHGPVTAAQLAKIFELTPAAIRRHLDLLEDTGQVRVLDKPLGKAGRGRPARQYVLTSTGHQELGTEYPEIAKAALKYLHDALGPDAVEAFAADRAASMREKYEPIVEAAGPAVEDRARALAAALTEDGYAASLSLKRPTKGFVFTQLCQGHCPILDVAAEYPQFCEAETETFAQLLGVDVRRLATLARGEHVCTTHIPHARNIGRQIR